MAAALVNADAGRAAVRDQLVEDLLYALAVVAHGVGITCNEQHGQILAERREPLLLAYEPDHAPKVLEAVQSENKGAALVVSVHINDVVVAGYPVVGSLGVGDLLAVLTEGKGVEPAAAVVVAVELLLGIYCQQQTLGTLHYAVCAAENGGCQLSAEPGAVRPGKKASHAVSEEEIRQAWVLVLHQLCQGVQVADKYAEAVLGGYVAPFLGLGAVAVAKMIVAADDEPL